MNMKCFSCVGASLALIFVVVGCQKAAPPAMPAASPTTQGAPGTQTSNLPDDGMPPSDNRAGEEQPDDPGMTTAHDKTIKQEQPSGDESSQAAPNEGDPEPPQ